MSQPSAGNTQPSALRATYDWTGEAATAYSRATSTQPTAAAEIQSIAKTKAVSLDICAMAIPVFSSAVFSPNGAWPVGTV